MEDVVAGALFIAIQAGAVIVIAAMGELIGEQSGVFNMGLEGTMAMGAVTSFIAVTLIPNPYLGMGMSASTSLSPVWRWASLAMGLPARSVDRMRAS
jgi:simple sugar transport system permease protein